MGGYNGKDAYSRYPSQSRRATVCLVTPKGRRIFAIVSGHRPSSRESKTLLKVSAQHFRTLVHAGGCNPNGWWQHGGQGQLWRCGPAFGPLPWAYGPESPSPRPLPEAGSLGIGEELVAPYAHRGGAKNWADPPTSASTPQLCTNNFAFADIVLEV